MKNEKRSETRNCVKLLRFSFLVFRFSFALPFPPIAAGFALFAADLAATPWLTHARLLSCGSLVVP
jgi:hypothetical protein